MERLCLSVVVLVTVAFAGQVVESAEPLAAPDAKAIQASMNGGVDLEFAQFQQFADVTIRSGGATQRNDHLFVCDTTLVWKVDNKEYKELYSKEIQAEIERQGDQGRMLKAFSGLILAQVDKLGVVEKGQAVSRVRFRVRLEQAGKDWVVTSSKVVELDSNPLRKVMTKNEDTKSTFRNARESSSFEETFRGGRGSE